MRSVIFWIFVIVAGLWTSSAWADIYNWVDEDGARHISNVSPPPHAKLLLRTEEKPRREAAIRDQQAAEKRRELLRAQAEIREREERLARKEAELERRIEAAEQMVDEAENRIEVAEARYTRDTTKQPVVFSYVTRPYAYRHYRYIATPYRYHHRYKHHRYRPHRNGLSLALRPFHLGSTTISINSGRGYHRKYSHHGSKVSHPRHNTGTHSGFHRNPRSGWNRR